MTEIRSMEWIERNAAAAVESLNAGGPKPVNPFDAETEREGHKAWAMHFYETALAIERVQHA